MLTISNFIKYIIEGFAVSVAAYLVAGKKSQISEIVLLGLIAAVTFMILDILTFSVVFLGVSQKYPTTKKLFQKFQHNKEFPNFTFGESIFFNEGFDSGTNINSYGKQDVNSMGEIPYRFPDVHKSTCPQQPVHGTTTTIPYGPTRTGSRWMDWIENCKPVNKNICEYKIVPGLYGKYIVQPGYREHIKTGNSDKINNLANTIWKTNNPIDNSNHVSREQSVPLANKSTEKKNNNMIGGSYEGYENPQTVRLSDVVYSGDIIDIMSGDTIMQRGLVNSQIIFDKPLPNVKTNLSKVRLIHAAKKHNPRRQVPIKYGDPVYIKHNAMINNNNDSKFIKYGDKLQSHQDGPLFRVYKIYNKKDAKSHDYIRYGDDILISRGDLTGDKTFLKVESDKSVTSESTTTDATTFTLSLERVYELYDRNLCVCPRENIYP